MFDLHSHLLPGIDDGAADLSVSLEMARIFHDQGVQAVACTPHILPGVYHNTGEQIRQAVGQLQDQIYDAGIDLRLTTGADNHIVANFVPALNEGHLLTLGDSRYVLVEPPHHVPPPRIEEFFFSILIANYVPILTHPERLTWIDEQYGTMVSLANQGVWMQITSGSLLGRFGRRPKYWAERMVSEGLVHILASDAHDTKRRPPDLFRGRRAAERLVGAVEADNLVVARPLGVLRDVPPGDLPRIVVVPPAENSGDNNARQRSSTRSSVGMLGRMRNLFGR